MTEAHTTGVEVTVVRRSDKAGWGAALGYLQGAGVWPDLASGLPVVLLARNVGNTTNPVQARAVGAVVMGIQFRPPEEAAGEGQPKAREVQSHTAFVSYLDNEGLRVATLLALAEAEVAFCEAATGEAIGPEQRQEATAHLASLADVRLPVPVRTA